ncbi:MAG: hypothetical protein NVSMB55_10830 [Mycobacteriales bacterium]
MGSPAITSVSRDRPVGPSVLTVWRLTAAVHVALAVSVVVLVALRLLGLRVGVVAESGLIVATLFTALLLSRCWGRGGRE